MIFDGIHGFDAATERLVADEIHHALEHAVPDDEPHAPAFDMEHFFHAVCTAFDVHHDFHGNPVNIGSPDGHGFTKQTTAFSCAVVSQKMLLDAFHIVSDRTGKPLSERELMYDAVAHGWLSENGTSISDMGKLLDHCGIACHHGSGWNALLHDLAVGHHAIIALNADGLWTSHPSLSPLMHVFGSSPNHALVLKGLRMDERGHVMVVVNDPGRPDGAGNEYPLSQFQDAVHDSQFHFVATDRPPPDWVPPTMPADSMPSLRDVAPDGAGYVPTTESYADLLEAMDDDHKHELMRLL